MTVADIATTARVGEVLTAAGRLNSAERLLVARWLLDSVLTSEIDEEKDWQRLSLSAFEQEWDNEEDAIYDNWRELYDRSGGLPRRI